MNCPDVASLVDFSICNHFLVYFWKKELLQKTNLLKNPSRTFFFSYSGLFHPYSSCNGIAKVSNNPSDIGVSIRLNTKFAIALTQGE
jgi:hypothetical protein